MTNFDRMLKPTQVAKILGVTNPTLGNWRKSGVGPPFIKIGSNNGAIRYSESKLLAFLNT